MNEEFQGAIDEAKKLEKKMVEYAPYSGEVFVEKSLDLEPREYVDMGYPDMINMYERVQKIISATGMGILAEKGAAPAEATVETGEVETRLRQMSSESLKQAEEVGKEPIVIEKEITLAPEHEEKPPEPSLTLEFETKPAEEVPAPSPRKEEIEIGEEKPRREEKPEAPSERESPPMREERREAPIEKKVIVAVPPVLRESPDQAASKRYEQMQEQIKSVVGEKADEATIKKKMLELTKQLFKEKSFNKREEIKVQITALKNMLAAAQAPLPSGAARPSAAGAGKAKDETSAKLFETVLNTHQGEIAQTKDNISDSYNKQIATIKKKFYEDLSGTEDPGRRKQIFEAFVFSVTSLVEQLPEVIKRYNDFTAKKHRAELEKLRASLSKDDKELSARVGERLDYLSRGYEKEFASVKGIIGRDIENLIEVAGSEIFKKPEEKPRETEERIYETVKEINETDEGTLLYFLHNKDPDYYKKYERKLLSKSETIFKAKELMAKEKGLSDAVVKKYFTQVEG